MKKLLAVLMMGLVATSYGIVNVNWGAAAGFYCRGDMEKGILGPGKSAIAQLMYSPDAIRDTLYPLGNTLTSDPWRGGNDMIWASLLITENGVSGDYDDFAAFSANETRAFTSGYVYAVIVPEVNLHADPYWFIWSGGEPVFYTPMLALVDITGANLPQGIQMNTDLIQGDPIDVIPEPATALSLVLGGLVVTGYRRLRKSYGF